MIRSVNVSLNRWNVKVIGILSPPFGVEGQTACLMCSVQPPFSGSFSVTWPATKNKEIPRKLLEISLFFVIL